MSRIGWDNIIGHRENTARLRALIDRDKAPHALLFAGPLGVGKFLTARTAAAALLCSVDEKPCGGCASCRAFLSGNHPDLTVVEPEGQAVKIEQIRKLQREISLAPYLSGRRIVILKDADKMTLPAANSLLKTLEEPVGDTVFILLAESRQLLLDTILSRCMAMLFQPLPAEDIMAVLHAGGMKRPEAEAIARLSGGSLSRALKLEAGSGLKARDQAAELLLNVPFAPLRRLWLLGEKAGAMERGEAQEMLLYFHLLLRDALVLKYGKSGAFLYNPDMKQELLEMGAAWPRRKIFFAFQEIINMQKMLQANGNIRLIMEQFMIKLRDE